MSIRNLDHLFQPRSVAVIGASTVPQSVGATVMRNILAGGFKGTVYPVNPKYADVEGVRAYDTIEALPQTPDLAVICTPPATVPELISQLGRRGTKAAIVLTAGLGAARNAQGQTLLQAMLDAAKPHLLRILGPNCVGLLAPGIGLNASFAHTQALPGKIAFISQSGALVTAVLDWARSRSIGFSNFISIGEHVDIDFADLIDYLGSDNTTRAILLYIESIKNARKFMSAARAAARNKPIIVVKAGRAPAGARAAASHTGALAGSDIVFDAAIRRAGMLRVNTMLELFSAAETLSHVTRFSGEHIAVMTNGGGAGVMAADAIALGGAELAELSPATMATLDRTLPPTWSRGNPVDIIGDAPAERYVAALKALCDDPQCDAVLFIHAPTAIVPSDVISAACAPVAAASGRLVLSCWLGDEAVAKARKLFHAAGIPDYGTPEEAVRAFLQLVTYRKNQDLLLETPPAAATHSAPDTNAARHLVDQVVESGREWLTEPEAKALLSAYGIAGVETRVAATVTEAVSTAKSIGYPVVLKILSPDITHKTDAGGVALNLENAKDVRDAARAMLTRVAAQHPTARVSGFSVQSMVHRPGAHELIAGASVDPLFGPVILFGHGGTAVEVIADRALALPPISVPLARDLVAHTRVARLLAGYRGRPRADLAAIYRTLELISQLMIDFPQIVEIDINPLLADAQGVIALDARVRVERAKTSGYERLAIRPYPRELEEPIEWNAEHILLRPIRPDDTVQHMQFLENLDPEDVRMRIFYSKRHFARSELARLTQIDYEREMAFVATAPGERGEEQTLGVVRTSTDPENMRAEFGLIVRSDLKGRGLGRILLEKMVRYCRARGTNILVGEVLKNNHRMLTLSRELGFTLSPVSDAGTVLITLPLFIQTSEVDHTGAAHD